MHTTKWLSIFILTLTTGCQMFNHQSPTAQITKKKIVFIAGPPSHGFAAHEHNAGCLLLAKCLSENLPNIETAVYQNGWPKDNPHFLDNADAIVIYCDGGPGHLAVPHLKELDDLAKKGVGIGCIHYAVEVEKGEPGNHFLDWIGGYFETFKSINPHWTAHFTSFPNHPVASGLHPFTTNDEWYYHMRFRDNMNDVTPILSAVPPDSTRQGKDDAHGGNPEVRAGIGQNLPEHVMWVSEGPTNNRGFGITGGHVHWNWAQDDFRKAALNAIVWIAHGQVPPTGIPSKRPALDDLIANQDEKLPANFDREKTQAYIDGLNTAQIAK